MKKLTDAPKILSLSMDKDDKFKKNQLDTVNKIHVEDNIVSLVGVEFVNEKTVHFLSKSYTEQLLDLAIRTSKRSSFHLKIIHDDFGCLPIYIEILRQTYREILSELYESDWFANTVTKIAHNKITLPYEYNKFVKKAILKGIYAIS